MDDTIKEIYDFSVKSQEHETDLIKNRLEFINWLFGLASTLLVASVLAARTITPFAQPAVAPENHIALAMGVFAFISLLFVFVGKWQGYNSVANRITILTLLNIQKAVFLKVTPPSGDPEEKFVVFSEFGYLPESMKKQYDSSLAYSLRKYSEILWLYLISGSVMLSLTSMLALLIELSI